jgi:hypothetical protein
MKFLLDMPVSPTLIDTLRAYGHEGVHAHQIGQAQAPDIDLLLLLSQFQLVEFGINGVPANAAWSVAIAR